jgi:hypothetical protein
MKKKILNNDNNSSKLDNEFDYKNILDKDGKSVNFITGKKYSDSYIVASCNK